MSCAPLRAAIAGVLLGVLAVFVWSGPASAHAALLSSDPPAGTVLDAEPPEVVLTFSEPVRAVADQIKAIGPDGTRADAGKARVRGDQLHVPLRPGGARGTYVLSYRIISADSHPVAGGLVFSVGTTSTNAARSGVNRPTTTRVMQAAVAAARFAGYAGLILVTGPVLFLLLLWPRRLATTGLARLAFAGAGVLLVATVAELYLQVPYSTGSAFSVGAAEQVFASAYGTAHLVRVAALAALLVVLRPVVQGHAGTADRALLGLLAVIGAATWPISGHPSASRAPLISVVADAAHLAAMAVWLGGLIVVVGFLLRQANLRELRAIMPVWSRWALVAVITITVTGAVNALVEIDSFGSLFRTLYGQLLLAKIGLLAVIVGTAAFARREVNRSYVALPPGEPPTRTPAQAKAEDPIIRSRLRRHVLIELAIAVVVVSVASVLVQSTPGRSATASANSGPYSVTLTTTLYQLQFDIEPLTTGANTLHLYAYTPDGGPIKVLEWHATVALPAQGIEPVDIPLVVITDSHATGQATLPTAGTWELRFTLRTTDIDEVSVSQKVPVH